MSVDVNKEKYSLDELLQIMSVMRSTEYGCKWTQEQSWESLVHHTIEEAYELVDSVENGTSNDVKGELADMLNQIIFYSQIAQEEGKFDLSDIITHLAKKLISRHPNVFLKDGSENLSYHELESQWEEIKKQETMSRCSESKSILDNLVTSLPSLSYAQKLQKKAALVGFDWGSVSEILPKIDEEITEFEEAYAQGDINHALEEIGDVMFTCVNLVRHLGSDAETIMRKANKKFETRFRKLEGLVDFNSKVDLSKEILEDAWQIAKMS
jgi:ATP diphosphatase